jgi:hypothetical protein
MLQPCTWRYWFTCRICMLYLLCRAYCTTIMQVFVWSYLTSIYLTYSRYLYIRSNSLEKKIHFHKIVVKNLFIHSHFVKFIFSILCIDKFIFQVILFVHCIFLWTISINCLWFYTFLLSVIALNWYIISFYDQPTLIIVFVHDTINRDSRKFLSYTAICHKSVNTTCILV